MKERRSRATNQQREDELTHQARARCEQQPLKVWETEVDGQTVTLTLLSLTRMSIEEQNQGIRENDGLHELNMELTRIAKKMSEIDVANFSDKSLGYGAYWSVASPLLKQLEETLHAYTELQEDVMREWAARNTATFLIQCENNSKVIEISTPIYELQGKQYADVELPKNGLDLTLRVKLPLPE